MIDGIYPSQFVEVQNLHSSHYRNLKKIVNKHRLSISFPSPRFTEISNNRKINHQNWKSFNQLQSQQINFKKNLSIFQKLQKISTSKSPYRYKTQTSTSPKNPFIHHNSYCQYYKKFPQIKRDNILMVSRIVNTKSIINNKKLQQDYKANKLTGSRLEKFQRFKRMTRIVSRSIEKKITRESFNTTKKSFIDVINPQTL